MYESVAKLPCGEVTVAKLPCDEVTSNRKNTQLHNAILVLIHFIAKHRVSVGVLTFFIDNSFSN